MTNRKPDLGWDFVPGLTQVIVLRLIDKDREQAYGQGLTRAVSKITKTHISSALIYGALERLVRREMVECYAEGTLPGEKTKPEKEPGRPRRFYQLTDKGRKILRQTEKAFTF